MPPTPDKLADSLRPFVSSTMPSYRLANFARTVGERLRKEEVQGKSRQETTARMVRELQAMTIALGDPRFVDNMADDFRKLMAKESPNETDAVSQEDALAEIKGILQRRAADMQYFATVLQNPEFVAIAVNAPAHAAGSYKLPPAKIEEMIRRLVQESDVNGPEPDVHVAASAMGQRQLHHALSVLYAPDGLMLQPLAEALRRAMPEASDDEAKVMAADWLKARQGPALATTAAMQQDSAIYREALRRSREAKTQQAVTATEAEQKHINASLMATTMLTPAQLESQKSSQSKAEDIIYTLNHAVTCLTVTDTLIGPAVAGLTEKWFGKRMDIFGHGHDHSHGGHDHEDCEHGHDHHHDHQQKSLFARIGDWMIGEFVGDVGAVPFTIAVQRFAPGFMDGLRNFLEPLIGGAFKKGAQRAAEHWGEKQGMAPDNQAVTDRAQKLYQYEIRHLPQMLVWTASSVGINYATMKLLNKNLSMGTFIRGKAVGAGTTAGLVFGVRALAPGAAHSWDETAGRNVVLPVTRTVGKLFGVKDSDIEAYRTKRAAERSASWSDRVQDGDSITLAR